MRTPREHLAAIPAGGTIQAETSRTPMRSENEAAREDMKPLLAALYGELLRSGVDPDEALSIVAAEEKRLKAEWEEAQRADSL